MDRTTLGLIVFVLMGVMLAVINRRISPPKSIEQPATPTKRSVESTMWQASRVVGLIAVIVFRGFLVEDVGLALLLAFIAFFISLPFTFITTFFYRKTKQPFRFELPIAVLGGGLGFLVYWIMFDDQYQDLLK